MKITITHPDVVPLYSKTHHDEDDHHSQIPGVEEDDVDDIMVSAAVRPAYDTEQENCTIYQICCTELL